MKSSVGRRRRRQRGAGAGDAHREGDLWESLSLLAVERGRENEERVRSTRESEAITPTVRLQNRPIHHPAQSEFAPYRPVRSDGAWSR